MLTTHENMILFCDVASTLAAADTMSTSTDIVIKSDETVDML